MSERPLHIGIDLGTTNSVAVVYDGERIDLVRNRQGGNLTPSVVRIDARGNVVVGDRARRLLETDPDNTRSEFKRLMGTDQRLLFPASGKSLKPEELAAEVLRAIRHDIADQAGQAPERAVISVPALFELPQISATSEAARLAGFAEIEVIQEPVASAIAAGWADDEARSWLVYDLGGGTFDASLLETREGLLRIVGHDGDNFLGGRDIDGAIVAHLLASLEAQGHRVNRADPSHAQGLRRLRHAAEEAKLELARENEAAILVPAAFRIGSAAVDVDAWLDRATLDALALPLVDRSLNVCLRLLASRGMAPADLDRIVLVGGPTVMPLLRRRVSEVLGAPVAEGLDPMTLVARGAALFAATAGIDGRPRRAEPVATGPRVWLQHPAVTSDPAPYVVGRLLDSGRVTSVRIERDDGGWTSDAAALDEAGAFAVPVSLRVRQPNTFRLVGVGADGHPIVVHPSEFRIVHGLTVADPPLSRSIGVALADDTVQVYLDRGTPLPMRRSFTHRTAETVTKGAVDFALNVPIVQGEVPVAHLCRLVGRIQIPGTDLQATLPAGSPVEVSLELDRSGRLSVRAFVPALQQTFDQVAWLVVPRLSLEALAGTLDELLGRSTRLRVSAFGRQDVRVLGQLEEARRLAAEVLDGLTAARGGDLDAGEKARRAAIELDGLLYDLESDASWPELTERARSMVMEWSGWVARYGEPTERRAFADMVERARNLITARNGADLERLLRQMKQLGAACYLRDPGSWGREFEYAASRISESVDLPQASRLVAEGRHALGSNDQRVVERVVRDLWRLLPPDPVERRLGHDSGLR